MVKNKPYYKLTEKCREVFFSSKKKGEESCETVTPKEEGVAKRSQEVLRDGDTSVAKRSHDSKLLYNIIDTIYNNYFSRIPSDKKKYNKSAQSGLSIFFL